MGDALSGEIENTVKCEYRIRFANPILQAKRDNKSVYIRNVISFFRKIELNNLL